ncbi:hypothetical protein [Dyadobacter sp. 3J3]|uniref:hypothetical protein n=1 Tax=Dyadobacter sp. 3J3 TaxID=2606600 RepID=UPI001359B623|nr:hypothetical protein [Dyadobacter sp. 3J3]
MVYGSSNKNDEEYEQALKKIYALMQFEIIPNSAKSNELEILAIVVKDYENVHFPIPQPIEN